MLVTNHTFVNFSLHNQESFQQPQSQYFWICLQREKCINFDTNDEVLENLMVFLIMQHVQQSYPIAFIINFHCKNLLHVIVHQGLQVRVRE